MTAGTTALLMVIGAAVGGVAVLTKDGPDAPRIVTAVGEAAAPQADAELQAPAPPPYVPAKPGLDPAATLSRTTDQADRTGPREPHRAAEAPSTTAAAQAPVRTRTKPDQPQAPVSAAPAQPSITTRTDVEKREVPFQTRFVRDPSLPRGTRKVTAAGVPGEEALRYLVTLTDGQETDRKLMDITVTREPQDRVITFGSRRGFGRPHGGRDRECRRKLDLCVPLGRQAKAYCPDDQNEMSVLDQDIELLDLDALGGEPPQMDCATKPEISTLPQ
jgi:hypothetical protein